MITTSTITLDVEPNNDLNMANMQHWDVYCKPGKLVMFPSHLYHSVTKNASDQDRLTLAFNLWPKGPLGSAGLDKIIF
jgi:ectoine hydroxylase-related dioxygenase (phytanoyl-CoA dioxygenase family)